MRSGRTVIIAAMLGFAVQAAAQPAQPEPPRTGTSTIRGRVVDAASGRPVRRARVNLFPSDFDGILEEHSASTDADGGYELTMLPAGRYSIGVSKSGYISWAFGQTQPRQSGRPIDIADKQTIERVDIAIPAGGTISGRVVDEYGDPMMDAQVQLLRTIGDASRPLQPFNTVNTNDVGEFRVSNVQPGQYYIAASALAMALPPDVPERVGWARTFFPSTTEASEARRFTVALGRSISDVSIQLIPIRPVRVSGTAVNSQGRPLIGRVMALRHGDFGSPAANGGVRPDGTFVINGLAPGDYTLQVNEPPSPDAELATMPLAVGSDDIESVALVGAPPAVGTGRIVIDSAATATLQPSALHVYSMPAPANGVTISVGPSPPPGSVAEDFTFEVKSWPGRRRLGVNNLPPGWTVRAVRAGSTDVSLTGVDFRAGRRVSDIEIELTNVTTTISGAVTTERGEVPPDYTVAIFPQERERWTAGGYARTVRPNQLGQYRLRGLQPGDYFLIALPSVDYEDLADPDFAEKASRSAVRISLREGETKVVDLRLSHMP